MMTYLGRWYNGEVRNEGRPHHAPITQQPSGIRTPTPTPTHLGTGSDLHEEIVSQYDSGRHCGGPLPSNFRSWTVCAIMQCLFVLFMFAIPIGMLLSSSGWGCNGVMAVIVIANAALCISGATVFAILASGPLTVRRKLIIVPAAIVAIVSLVIEAMLWIYKAAHCPVLKVFFALTGAFGVLLLTTVVLLICFESTTISQRLLPHASSQ